MDRENKPPSLALSGRSSRGNTENEIKMKDLTLSCEPPVSPKPTSSTSTSKSTSTTAKSYKPLPFVEGWELVDVLGEGAYGEVRLARHKVHNEYVAVKVVSINDKNKDLLRKEIGILKMVQHRNIIKFYGDRAVENDNEKQIFIFLEYAENGELFDRIEPDVGMVKKDVFKYFSQLLDGVEYLHENGIVHRDIKPENLLLDHDSNLKISDFGLATLFRCKGRERKLNTCCGTPSYCAPEVLGGGNFYAEPIDVWSCGIVLVAMLAGELPWDEPRDSFKEFDDWKKRFFVNPPWSKLDTLALGLCLKVLNVQPIQRASIPVIRKDPWFVKHLAAASRKRQYSPSTSPSSAQSPSRPYKMVCSRIENSPARVANMDSRHSMAQSQPVTYSPVSKTAAGILDASDVSSNPKDLCGILVMSQPEDFKALAITQTGVGSQRLRMVNRMTRFYSKVTLLETTNIIQRYLEHNGISYKIVDLIITATMMDSRSRRLVWKLALLNVAAYSLVLVDVRRSKGDGIEFKKQFVKLKTKLNDIICERSPFATGSFF